VHHWVVGRGDARSQRVMFIWISTGRKTHYRKIRNRNGKLWAKKKEKKAGGTPKNNKGGRFPERAQKYARPWGAFTKGRERNKQTPFQPTHSQGRISVGERNKHSVKGGRGKAGQKNQKVTRGGKTKRDSLSKTP